MKEFFVDLHVHIGSGSKGEPVKITASSRLIFENILEEALYKKGLDMVGIVDAASPVVIRDIEDLFNSGEMVELSQGGIKYRDELVIILGSEVESREEGGGQVHYLAFFPFFKQLKEYSSIMDQYITNINLSSQSTGLKGVEIFKIIDAVGGIMIPAHVFTPHKSFYGNAVASYREIFTDEQWEKIPAIELGLSADSYMADYLSELEGKTFLSNSDAHSLSKIAREYNKIKMEDKNFNELKLALKKKDGRGVFSNFGLDPRLGKYHRTFCNDCQESFPYDRPVYQCPICGGTNLVIGVKDRILKISDKGESLSPEDRPPYIHQVPLEDIPGIGKKTLERLLNIFGTEMDILHRVEVSQLYEAVNKKIADNINKSRSGGLKIKPGGGGVYGKVVG